MRTLCLILGFCFGAFAGFCLSAMDFNDREARFDQWRRQTRQQLLEQENRLRNRGR